MANRKQSSSCHQQQQHIDADEKLWQELNIIVALETFQFPNNKIHGTIRIEPESSRKFIQMFFFVIDNLYEYEFDPSYVDVIVSGLNMNIRNRSIYIKAIPINTKWKPSVKISKEFKFNSKVFELIPRLSFIWLDEDKIRTPHLVIQWDHIEDKYAQGYVLYLDDVMIKNIYKNQIEDQFKVTIRGFEPGKKHIFQLASKLDST
ncbi:unnamed protein product [Rotaria sp. Silwood2]|nr:unnamed protein product [Rotaria sp. Silwood2]CAF4190362.1 unnamed protein product [Rotaria sp. Silwood2]CAF4503226.1 unnamed protein product [Rotaria sp. Silwood2]